MAGDWIKIRHSLIRDGRVRIVSRSCHASVTSVLGGLVTLWCLADEHADENGNLFGYTTGDINTEIGIENFCESLPLCWIDISGEFVKLPDYQEHNGTTGKRRAQDLKRQQTHRKMSQSQRDKNVTREEKRREDIKESKKKSFVAPSQQDVIDYFLENGYTKESGLKAFNYYSTAAWKDSQDKPVKNWKQKMQGVWFKPENKAAASAPVNPSHRPFSVAQ